MAHISDEAFEHYINDILIEGAALNLPDDHPAIEALYDELYNLLELPLGAYRGDIVCTAIMLLRDREVFKFDR